MGLVFFFIFILWGWAEMSAFIFVGGKIGGLLTLLGVFVTAILGLSLLKGQGKAVMARIHTDFAQGHAPVGSIADSVALAVGGILMLIPGYVTDAVGVILFLPWLRTIAGAWILHYFASNNQFKGFVNVGGQSGFRAQTPHSFAEDDDVIEGDVSEHTPNKNCLDNK
jgi:UPF0716 protein FxsA